MSSLPRNSNAVNQKKIEGKKMAPSRRRSVIALSITRRFFTMLCRQSNWVPHLVTTGWREQTNPGQEYEKSEHLHHMCVISLHISFISELRLSHFCVDFWETSIITQKMVGFRQNNRGIKPRKIDGTTHLGPRNQAPLIWYPRGISPPPVISCWTQRNVIEIVFLTLFCPSKIRTAFFFLFGL